MAVDFIFQGPPSSTVASPGTTIAPAIGLDTINGVGYINAGSGWKPQAPGTVANLSKTAQTANISTTTAYAVPAHMGGQYAVTVYIKVTTAGSVSSTMPSVSIAFTDNGDSVAQSIAATATNTGNTTTTLAQATVIVWASGGTNIQYSTASYASSAAGMAYELNIRVTYLG